VSERELPSVNELNALVRARAETPDTACLQAALGVARELNDAADALLELHVVEARRQGLSWAEIGRLFGTSKQAAQQRYGAAAAQLGVWPGRWTPAAHRTLTVAGEQAEALGHVYVGTEHALLAMLDPRAGATADVLRDLGISHENALARLPGPPEPRRYECVGVMPRLKLALEAARLIADGLGHQVAGTEHLLAGIVSVPDALAVEIIAELGVSADDVRAALGARLGIDAQRLASKSRRRRRRLLTKSA
jgi:Clp amino terminal domain, pathogenicity island component